MGLLSANEDMFKVDFVDSVFSDLLDSPQKIDFIFFQDLHMDKLFIPIFSFLLFLFVFQFLEIIVENFNTIERIVFLICLQSWFKIFVL